MLRVICIDLPLHDDIAHAADEVWRQHPWIDTPVLSGVEQIVQHLRTADTVAFRVQGHEQKTIFWQRTGPIDAMVQEREHGHLLRVHQLTRGPTGEVWWQQRLADGVTGNNFALADAILIPAFAVVTDQWQKHHAHLRRHLEESP